MAWEKWKRFARMFRPRIHTLVGVDFGHGAVKVAEVSLAGDRPYLKTFAMVDAVEEYETEPETPAGDQTVDTDRLTEQLARALSLSGAHARHAVLSVGGRTVFVREVPFPRLAPDELSEAIKWEIPKYVPYEPDSYEFDYAITGQDARTGDLRVLVVAAPKQVVRGLVQVARRAGLQPVAVDIEPLAVYRTLTGAENALIVNIGATSTQLALFQQGNPVFTRVVPISGGRISPALSEVASAAAGKTGNPAGFAEEIGQEIRRTAQFLSRQNNQTLIEKLVVTGVANVAGLARQLEQTTELPVIGHNPLAYMDLRPSIAPGYAEDMGPQLAVAVGLAMRGDEP
ncbi:MAG TPA: type IV pilus assembly protein PilM [Selenomonadales bacterium]|nr:type IV pilus assembly protein PilM [Selenomonadales bacterium]